MVGLSIDEYWEITPKKFEKYVEAYKQLAEIRVKEMDVSNYNLGKYIAYAVNEPKKYPKQPFSDRINRREQSGKDMEEMMKRNTILLGGKIK